MENVIELIYRARSGDRKALEEVIAVYDRKVYSFVYSIVRDENSAMDITQETFIKLFQNIQSFDMERNFITWLFTIAKNTAINYINKNIKYSYEDIETHRELAESHWEFGNPALAYEHREESLGLMKQIEELPEKYRVLIYMKYILDMSYEDISLKLGIPEHKVESRLYMARQKLQKQLKNTKKNDFITTVKGYFMPKL